VDDRLLDLYIREVGTQATFALESAHLYKAGVVSAGPVREVFFHLHHFLIHSSNVVKLLFPRAGSSPKARFAEQRAKAIRNRLGITEPLDPSQVNIRNDFEHFDERIDAWVQSSRRHNFADMNIMTKGSIKGLEPEDFFRNLDPHTLTLSFCGNSYDLNYLENYMQQVAHLAGTAPRVPL
jgi:hypothetical protein